MTPEGKVKAKVKKVLKELGCYYVMQLQGVTGTVAYQILLFAQREGFMR